MDIHGASVRFANGDSDAALALSRFADALKEKGYPIDKLTLVLEGGMHDRGPERGSLSGDAIARPDVVFELSHSEGVKARMLAAGLNHIIKGISDFDPFDAVNRERIAQGLTLTITENKGAGDHDSFAAVTVPQHRTAAYKVDAGSEPSKGEPCVVKIDAETMHRVIEAYRLLPGAISVRFEQGASELQARSK